MNGNRKLLLYGSISAIALIVLIAIFLTRLFSSSENREIVGSSSGELLYSAVPSDAVMLLDIKEAGNFKPLVEDTASVAYRFVDSRHLLNDFQRRVLDIQGAESLPVLFSMHYSSKNEVSVFCVIDATSLLSGEGNRDVLLPFMHERAKKYNKTDIYSYKDSLYVTMYANLVMASTSLYVLESSIRHLDNATSILDNAEFKALYEKNNGKGCLYVNHHQIGKFFSGAITRGFLKYSDFFLHYASWSCLELDADDGKLALHGVMTNGSEQKYNSSVLYSQLPVKSSMDEILPAETVYALGLSFSDIKGYTDAYGEFLEVHKRLSGYRDTLKAVTIEGEKNPISYLCDSLAVEEVVAAYCKFGDRYGWLTFVREKSSFGLGDMVGSVLASDKQIEVRPYIYKRYIKSVLGEGFSHCNEEAYCKIDSWHVIGPEDIVKEYALGNANYTSLEYYLGQTPAKDFFEKEGVVKVIVNPHVAKDSVLKILKPYYAKMLERSLEYKNFGLAAINVGAIGGEIVADASVYAVRMAQLPLAKPREELVQEIYVDSTIVVDNSSFELKDFTNGGKCYLEQLPNNKLRMLNGKKKGVWTIPFDTPLCGEVAQVDFFKNGKLQMLFVSGNKLYMLDRLGRIVRGFPLTLPKSVVYGPKVLDVNKDKNYSFMVLNEDNTISIYKLNRDKAVAAVELDTPEFVKELPAVGQIFGKNYLLLKTVQRLRIYNMNGQEIVVNDKRRAISPDSVIEEVAGSEIKVMGIDGKEFILDMATGKTKKAK